MPSQARRGFTYCANTADPCVAGNARIRRSLGSTFYWYAWLLPKSILTVHPTMLQFVRHVFVSKVFYANRLISLPSKFISFLVAPTSLEAKLAELVLPDNMIVELVGIAHYLTIVHINFVLFVFIASYKAFSLLLSWCSDNNFLYSIARYCCFRLTFYICWRISRSQLIIEKYHKVHAFFTI